MEIQHASLAQVRRGRDGRVVEVPADLFGVTDRLREIDPGLGVKYNEFGDYFVIYHAQPNGDEDLVTTTIRLTPDVVDHVRKLAHPSYDYVAELERLDRQAERDRDHRFHEQVGEAGERLAHAIRKDIGTTNRAFI